MKPPVRNPLEQRLIDHIRRYGPITFEAFMDAALYDESHGYYASSRRQPSATPVGTDGDYFTSPAAHPAFGALLALQVQEMWRRLGTPVEFFVVEMGAGDGVLRSDFTEYVERELDDFAKSLRYIATDLIPPSGSGSVEQNSNLPTGVIGCVISNELLDAFPVNRFIVQGAAVKEIFVDFKNDEFVEVVGDLSNPELGAIVQPFLGTLPESYRGEVNLRLGYWSDSVSATLDRGYVITIDYGYDRPVLYSPTRVAGSLRCYYQHTLGQNPLRRVGRQDITAHVDFTTVAHTLMVNNIFDVGHITQSEFLTNVGVEDFLGDVSRRSSARELSRSDVEEDLAGIGALVDPNGLGRFRVAVHSRGVEADGEPAAKLTGLVGGQSLASGHPAPSLELAMADHARLLRASSPFSQGQRRSGATPTWDQLFSDDL